MGGNRRLSIVFFHTPNYDTLVECLPTCRAPDHNPKYQPVSVADHYALKRQQQRARSDLGSSGEQHRRLGAHRL
jgi:isopenicillin N synthase-like dioxygenase